MERNHPESLPDIGRVFPYLIPAGYLEQRDPTLPLPRALGHELYLALAEDFDGIARIHVPEDLGALGTPDELLVRAQENLVTAVRGRVSVRMRRFDGPGGVPFILFGGDWRAAACLFLPDLHAFATKNLGPGPHCASVPHRDAMILFPDVSGAHRVTMQRLIAEKEAGELKPLTPHLFAIAPGGFWPLST